jgi:zinc finger SWIM domain-containing protein 3
MANLYNLREKWAAAYRDSFTADMNSTQRSEGMNNVFKKRFRRKLGLSELLEEFEKVSSSLHNNELDEDFNSRRKSPVTHIPLLKTAAESYTGRMYKKFEEEFNKQFSFSCKLLQTEGSILTYTVTHMHSDYGATVVFNKADSTITCACRKYESIGTYIYSNLNLQQYNILYKLMKHGIYN